MTNLCVYLELLNFVGGCCDVNLDANITGLYRLLDRFAKSHILKIIITAVQPG